MKLALKLALKLGIPLAVVIAIFLSFAAVDDAQAGWPAQCPPNHCPQVLDGYHYVSTCASDSPGQSCLGWIYQKGTEVCHVPALQ